MRKECKEYPAEWGVGEEAGQALQKSDPLLIWLANRSDHHCRHLSNPTWQARVSTGTMHGTWMVLLVLVLATSGELGEHGGAWGWQGLCFLGLSSERVPNGVGGLEGKKAELD